MDYIIQNLHENHQKTDDLNKELKRMNEHLEVIRGRFQYEEVAKVELVRSLSMIIVKNSVRVTGLSFTKHYKDSMWTVKYDIDGYTYSFKNDDPAECLTTLVMKLSPGDLLEFLDKI